jgi:hypothetical protein
MSNNKNAPEELLRNKEFLKKYLRIEEKLEKVSEYMNGEKIKNKEMYKRLREKGGVKGESDFESLRDNLLRKEEESQVESLLVMSQ